MNVGVVDVRLLRRFDPEISRPIYLLNSGLAPHNITINASLVIIPLQISDPIKSFNRKIILVRNRRLQIIRDLFI